MATTQFKLTDWLLKTANTNNALSLPPFLERAAAGTLSKDDLSFWLSQDKIYAAHTYPCFVGALISKIPFFDVNLDSTHSKSEEEFYQKILSILTGSLTNVIREVNFFGDTAKLYELQLDGWLTRRATKDYVSEMIKIGKEGSLEEGLVFLWAMEKVFLDIWSVVNVEVNKSENVLPAVQALAENWSNPAFAEFVQELADIVDNLGIKPETPTKLGLVKRAFERVLEIEEAFWPVHLESQTSRRKE